jgi:hypothetical protein
MRPMLGDLPLMQVQTLRVHDRRVLAEHHAPGMGGSLLQNMGRRPAGVSIAGVATGHEALAFIETLNGLFAGGDPVSFAADIVADADIDQMVIDDFQVREVAGKPERFAYALILREHIEPVEPEDVSGLQTDILNDATSLIDDLVDGLDLSLDFATGLERFVGPLTDLLGRLQELNRGNGAPP